MAINSSFCQQFLCLIIVICNFCSEASKEITNSCGVSNGEKVTFYNCSQNCSQKDFNCTIGGLEDVQRYQLNKDPLYNLAEGFLDPPQLLDIRYQMVSVTAGSKRDWTGSIHIQFRLPTARKNVMPHAVQLYFQGINEKDYYFRCPRQRIFEFHNYKPANTYDEINPRIISYNCFYGVDSLPEGSNYANDYRTKFKKGYTLGLKSHPGRWINYTITINAISPMISRNQWIPTVAVSLNVTNRSLLVLVEKELGDIQVIYSYAYLQLLNGVLHRSVELDKKTREGLFTNLTHGRFVVMVNITGMYNGSQMYWSAETLEIDATGILEEYPLHYADLNMGPVKIASVVLGCFIGVALLVLFGVVVYRRRECKKIVHWNRKSSGIILHPFDKQSTPEFFKFVECYEIFLEKCCSCSLFPWKRIRSRSISKLKTWLENEFRNLSFIIVFYNRCLFDRNKVNIDSFCMVLQKIGKLDNSQLTIIPIKMPGSAKLPTLIEQISTVNWDDFEKLYCKIHGEIQCPVSKRDMLTGNWRSTDFGKSLLEKFGKLELERNIETYQPSETEDQNDSSIVANNQRPERIEEKKPDVKENVEEYADSVDMNDFAMDLNRENDSVIGELWKNKRNTRVDYNKDRSKSKEYNSQTSVHSVQADVHSDSFNETIINYLTDSSRQTETNDTEMDLRNSDKPHSLSASNASNFSDKSQRERSGSYKDRFSDNQHVSPPYERRQDYISGEASDSFRQRLYAYPGPYHSDKHSVYLEEPNNGNFYSHDYRDMKPYEQHYSDIPHDHQYVYHDQEGQHHHEYDHVLEYQEHQPLLNHHFANQYRSDNDRHYHMCDHMNNPELFLPRHTSSPPSMYMPPTFRHVCPEINRNPDVNRPRNQDPQSHYPNSHGFREPETRDTHSYYPNSHGFREPESHEDITFTRNPCMIIKRNPVYAETVNHDLNFRARDPGLLEDEFRSRSRTIDDQFPRNRSTGDLELEDMKSISQQDINEEGIVSPNDGFVSPVHSNRSSGESISSQYQVAELMNINKSVLLRKSF